MYGYATDETPEFLPASIVKVHALAKGLEDLRKQGEIKWIRPDGKTQITVVDGVIKTILVSTQHDQEVSHEEIKNTLTEKLIKPIIGDLSGIEILVNPTGRFVQGGFEADTGLTGRKIMVDTYCGLISHGGGCFSGKDPTKVDRSGAYMARFVAKNLVANGYAKECLVSLAYAIGRAEPLMVEAINEKGENLSEIAKSKFDFKPLAIIEKLDLRRPIYQQTAAYGHFGRAGLPWEKIIKIA
jgi:S-adenosylmethionine synthetase